MTDPDLSSSRSLQGWFGRTETTFGILEMARLKGIVHTNLKFHLFTTHHSADGGSGDIFYCK